MPQATTTKVYKFLCYLQKTFESNRQFSLDKISKARQLPSEYAKWIVEDGLLIKTGGRRGRSSYQWNPKKQPSISIAEDMRKRYLSVRYNQQSTRTNNGKEENKIILSLLFEIKEMMQTLIKKNEHENHERRLPHI